MRREGAFFVDNSRFIAEIEKAGQELIFVRPPRFGKSLFMNMLAVYYDLNTSVDEFEKLF